MALTAPQRANVLATIQAAATAHPHPFIKAAVIAQGQRIEGDNGSITTVFWSITVGRVTMTVDEFPGDAAPANPLGRFAGKLNGLLADRLANP